MIIGLTGKKRSGKSTVARHLVENHGFVELSFAQPLKDMALAVNPVVDWESFEIGSMEGFVRHHIVTSRLADVVTAYGWEGAKDLFPEVRRFLQRLGTDGVRGHLGEDTWVDLMRSAIEKVPEDQNIVIADVRFENEADVVREARDATEGQIISIQRPGFDGSDDHASEKGVWSDFVVTNDGSIENLTHLVETLLFFPKRYAL